MYNVLTACSKIGIKNILANIVIKFRVAFNIQGDNKMHI